MSAFTTFAYGVLLMATVTSAMPQDLDNLEEVDDVSSRSNHGCHGSRCYSSGYYPSSWSSWNNGGYYNGGYYSGSSYGNSYNKAGYCPSYRKRRSTESDSEAAESRYYSIGNSYYGGSYYCNSDRDCTGNLKCCYTYGTRQCTYPYYSGGYGGK